MEYIYGKLNKEVEKVEYLGKETETTEVKINQKENIIEVNTKKTPKSLRLIKGTEEKTFDGSEQIDIVVPNMVPEDYTTNQAFNEKTTEIDNRLENLEKDSARLLYTDKTNPTAEDINKFVIGLGYTAPFEGVAVVVDETYHVWHYYENLSNWKDDGVDSINTFTNELEGAIKGSTEKGKISANEDGTGSVVGFEDKADIGYVDNKLSLKIDSTPMSSEQEAISEIFEDKGLLKYKIKNSQTSGIKTTAPKVYLLPLNFENPDTWADYKFKGTENIYFSSKNSGLLDGQVCFTRDYDYLKFNDQTTSGEPFNIEGYNPGFYDVGNAGDDVYCWSNDWENINYKLNKNMMTGEEVRFSGLPSKEILNLSQTRVGQYQNTAYLSYGSNIQLKLNKETETGEQVNGNGYTDIHGDDIGKFKGHLYYSIDDYKQLELNENTMTGEEKIGNKLPILEGKIELRGRDIGIANNRAYFNEGIIGTDNIIRHYSSVLNEETNSGEDIKGNNIDGFHGNQPLNLNGRIFISQGTDKPNKLLVTPVDGKPAVNKEPFKFEKTLPLLNIAEDNDSITLVNDNPVLFGKYGFSIEKIENNEITILALEEPKEKEIKLKYLLEKVEV